MPPCNHPPALMPKYGEPYTDGACRLCWLFVNDPKYRALWDKGGGETGSRSPFPAWKPLPPRKPCNCGKK